VVSDALTDPMARGMKARMSLLGSVKEVVVGRVIRLMSDPRLTKVASSPRVMNAAMKALNVGGNVKTEIAKATRLAAGVFGIATEEEVTALRMTVQNLEDTVATLEARGARGGPSSFPGASAVTDLPSPSHG